MMTQERAEKLTEFLTADAARARKLFALDANEAVSAINDSGYDFTVDELNEYCAAFKSAFARENGELAEDELEDVAGGVLITMTAGTVLALAGCFAGGVGVGVALGARW